MNTKAHFMSLFLSLFLVITVFAQEDNAPYMLAVNDTGAQVDFPLAYSNYDVSISGMIADVNLTQYYRNTDSVPIEAVYVFPLHNQSAVYGMEMRIGMRTIVAEIKEKNRARQEYQEARDEGRRTTLLEQHRPNVFEMYVANIMPGEQVEVLIKYTQKMPLENGNYQFVAPLVVGPRYQPARDIMANNELDWSAWGLPKKEGPSVKTPNENNNFAQLQSGQIPQPTFITDNSSLEGLPTVSINVQINSPVPINNISCLTHDILIEKQKRKSVNLRLAESERFAMNKDFILDYSLQADQIESGVMLYEHDDENFFMAVVQPPKRVTPDKVVAREYVFVVDVSGSMHGFPINVSKRLMHNLFKELSPQDYFNIVLFAGDAHTYSTTSVPATTANLNDALKIIDQQHGHGGTQLIHALKKGLALKRPSSSISRSLVLITDGYISVEKQAMDLIEGNLNNMNVFTFGIGSSVNRYLIDGLAHAGQGESFVVTNENQAKKVGSKFINYVKSPVWSRLEFTSTNIELYDVSQNILPDLFSERPIVITGKYRGNPEGELAISGYTGSGKLTKTLVFNNTMKTKNASAIRYLWARDAIAKYGDYGKTDEAKVTDLGLRYNLMTAYTSFIAVEKDLVANQSGQQIKKEQAVLLPEGVSQYAVGADFDIRGVYSLVDNKSKNPLLVIMLIVVIGCGLFIKLIF